MKPFGCLVWYWPRSQAKIKSFSQNKALPGTFVGFDSLSIVRILDDNGRIIRATTVHFQEYRTHGEAFDTYYEAVTDDSDFLFYKEAYGPSEPPNTPYTSRESLFPINDNSYETPSDSNTDAPCHSGRKQKRTAKVMGYRAH